jgi:hypothetical protein
LLEQKNAAQKKTDNGFEFNALGVFLNPRRACAAFSDISGKAPPKQKRSELETPCGRPNGQRPLGAHAKQSLRIRFVDSLQA